MSSVVLSKVAFCPVLSRCRHGRDDQQALKVTQTMSNALAAFLLPACSISGAQSMSVAIRMVRLTITVTQMLDVVGSTFSNRR